MSNNASVTSSPATSPWLLLWFRPRAAIRKVLSREGEGTALAIYALAGVATTAKPLGGLWQLFVPPVADALFAALVFALCAALGALSLYLSGYIVTSIARLFGGVGTRKATRAALAWSSPPLLLCSLPLATGLLSVRPAIVLAIIVIVAWIWQFVLAILMLAEAHALSRWRASATTILGWIANLALAFGFGVLLFQPFNVGSGGMQPTLGHGDDIVVSKFPYGYSRYSIPFAPPLFEGRIFAREPRRGDVIIFFLPERHTHWLKRVVGLPGDRVQMIEGRLYINNVVVPREPIAAARVEGRDGRMTEVPTYKETLPGGVEHTIIEIEGDRGVNDNTELFVVSPGHYFMMGDNRDNSTDSRVPKSMGGVGFVQLEKIVGRAVLIYLRQAEGAPEGRRRLHFEWVDAGLGTASTP